MILDQEALASSNKVKMFMKIIFTQARRREQHLIHPTTGAVVRQRVDVLCQVRRAG
jgi:hypothetical protein